MPALPQKAQKAQMIKNMKDYIYRENSFVLSVPLGGLPDGLIHKAPQLDTDREPDRDEGGDEGGEARTH